MWITDCRITDQGHTFCQHPNDIGDGPPPYQRNKTQKIGCKQDIVDGQTHNKRKVATNGEHQYK